MRSANPYESPVGPLDGERPRRSGGPSIIFHGYLGTVFAGLLGFAWLGWSNQSSMLLFTILGGASVACVGALVFRAAWYMCENASHLGAVVVSSLSGGCTAAVLFAVILLIDSGGIPRGFPIRMWTMILLQMCTPVAVGASGALFLANIRRMQLQSPIVPEVQITR